MKNVKKVLALVLVLVLTVATTIGATVAYLKDTDEKVNTFTVGNVKIEQYEKDRDGNDFEDDQKLLPIVHDSKDENGYHLGENYIDKIVTVKNTGTEAAFIRTHIAFPAALDDGAEEFNAAKNMLHWNGASANDTFGAANPAGCLDNDWYWDTTMTIDYPTTTNGGVWNCYQETVDGVLYNVYVATHKTAVNPEEVTAPTLFGVYLDKNVDYVEETVTEEGKEVVKGYYVAKVNGKDYKVEESVLRNAKILVVSEAVQSEGFDNAMEALNEAFGIPGEYSAFTK